MRIIKRAISIMGQLLGASLTSFAMAAVIYTYSPLLSDAYEAKITPKEVAGQKLQVSSPKTPTITFSQIVASKPPVEVIRGEAKRYGVNTRYSVAIPAIEAYANVVADVDPFNEADYRDALKYGVAHAKTTANPGEGKRIFLFSHSTDSLINVARYNAVFYELKKLAVGDRVIVFYQDERFEYEVGDIKVVEPIDTSWLEESSPEELVLQTCDPPGTTKRRLLVIAKPVTG